MYSYSEETVKHLAQIAAMEAEARAELAQIDLAAAGTDYPTAITVPDPMDLPIPTPMLVTAWKLAAAFWHRWSGEVTELRTTGAGYIDDDGAVQPVMAEHLIGVGHKMRGWTGLEIQAHCAMREAEQRVLTGMGWIGGIMAPAVRYLNPDDPSLGLVIEHTTVTGRSHWRVAASGAVDLYVSRPDPVAEPDPALGSVPGLDVLHAAIDAGGHVELERRLAGGVPYHRRHVVAMGKMLCALFESTDAWLLAASLMPEAQPDPVHWKWNDTVGDLRGALSHLEVDEIEEIDRAARELPMTTAQEHAAEESLDGVLLRLAEMTGRVYQAKARLRARWSSPLS